MSKIFVATPMYGGNCTASYVSSLLSLQIELIKNNHEIVFCAIQNESLITRARNTIANVFLQSDAEFLLFIDSDHGFNAKDVVGMIDYDLDILCAVPPKKIINWDQVRKAVENKEDNLEFFTGDFVVNTEKSVTSIIPDGPFEITAGGTGLMLIKRNVFEKMEPDLPKYVSNTSPSDALNKKVITEFFNTEIDNEILLSEDYSFCKKWGSLGGKIHAAPWITVTHIGSYEFKGSFLASLSLNTDSNLKK